MAKAARTPASAGKQQPQKPHRSRGRRRGKAGAPQAADNGELDSFRKLPELAALLQKLEATLQQPTAFLQASPELSQLTRAAAQGLYGLTARQLGATGGARKGQNDVMPELHVDNFDAEQIWMQLDLAGGSVLKRVNRLVKQAGQLDRLVEPGVEAAVDKLLAGGESDGQATSEEEEEEGGSDGGGAGSSGRSGSEGSEGSEEEPSDGEDEDEDEDEEAGLPSRAKRQKRAALEDRFLRLDELEAFLLQAERAAAGEEEEAEGEEEEEEAVLAELYGPQGGSEEAQGLEELISNSAALVGKQAPGAGGRGRGGSAVGGTPMMYSDFFDQPGEGSSDEGGSGEEEEEDEDMEEDGEEMDGSDEESEDVSEEEDEEGLSDGDDDGGEGEDGAPSEGRRGKRAAAGGQAKGSASAAAAGAGPAAPAAAALSAHEQRLLRLQERISELEGAALGQKDWTLLGEVGATQRPLNSALEVDMEYDTTVRPAPEPTEEMTQGLEDLIRRRIAEQRFDDVVRVVPPPVERSRREVELADGKSKEGLGEIYEAEYVRAAVGGTAADKDEGLRVAAKALFRELCVKLDALTHFHFSPKPVIEDVVVRSAEVPAIAMEEVAPVAVSKAALQLPGEVYAPGQDGGRPVAEGELSREERQARRAARKRAGKARRKGQEPSGSAAAAAQDQAALEGVNIVGRKSEAAAVAGSKRKRAGSGRPQHAAKSEFSKSSAVFAKLQEQQAQAAAGVKVKAASLRDSQPAVDARTLKL